MTEALLEHWMSHRRLTRRVIEGVPEASLFTCTPVEPLHPFGVMMLEVINVTEPDLRGFLTGE